MNKLYFHNGLCYLDVDSLDSLSNIQVFDNIHNLKEGDILLVTKTYDGNIIDYVLYTPNTKLNIDNSLVLVYFTTNIRNKLHLK
jgi:hypothetical protein